MEDIKRILAVSRMTTYCRRAIHFGISLAHKYNADLFVIHVVYNPFEYMNMPMVSMEEEYKKDAASIKKQLDKIIDDERKKGVRIKELVKKGPPTEQIMNVVREENIDLAVLHAHKDSFWDHFLYGYRSDELIRALPCSCLLVRNKAMAKET